MLLPRARLQPNLADLVALTHALALDEVQRSSAELAIAEQRLSGALIRTDHERMSLALDWVTAVEAGNGALRSLHQRAETAFQLTNLLIILTGVLFGWGAATAILYFDGSGRVNAVSVIGLLVVLPGAMILPFIFAALPASVAGRIPGFDMMATMARALSPGRLAPLFWRAFPREVRDALGVVSGRLEGHQRLFAGVQRWAVLRWSQLFALAFQCAALTACLVLVVFSDLAFGWSTTLTSGAASLDAERVHRITGLAAAPWSWAVADAEPSLALIEESRYYRVASDSVSRAQAARLGGWWKFVVLTIAVYGLLPRIITLTIARSRLRAATHAAVVTTPGLSALCRRLHRAHLKTGALQAESAADPVAAVPGNAAAASPTASVVRAVVNWSGVPVAAAALAAAFPEVESHAAGGAATMQEDLALAKQLGAGTRNRDEDVWVIVKAWEPPLMEFIDFLQNLRRALADSTGIVVLPVGLGGDDGRLEPPAPPQLKLWRDKLAQVGDPWLRVAASRDEVKP